MLLELPDPVSQRHCIMLAQALHVAQLESNSLGAGDYMRCRYKPSLGKNVLVDESVASPQAALCTAEHGRGASTCNADDRVIQEQPARMEHPVYRVEITGLQVLPHMLHHPD